MQYKRSKAIGVYKMCDETELCCEKWLVVVELNRKITRKCVDIPRKQKK